MEMTVPTALSLRNLSVSFDGLRAIDELSIEVSAGSIVALIGPNGAGKTTIFNLICGYLKVDSGTITIAGTNAAGSRPGMVARLGVGRSFQDGRVFEQMSSIDNVLLGMRDQRSETMASAIMRRKRLRYSEQQRLEKAVELLGEAGLDDKTESLACDLSYGQRKLLELCRVRALNPSIYLLDEPFSGLFPDAAKRMASMIKALRDSGKTVIFIEHDMEAVVDISDRVVVLDFGRKIADGIPTEVLNDPTVLDVYLGRISQDAP